MIGDGSTNVCDSCFHCNNICIGWNDILVRNVYPYHHNSSDSIRRVVLNHIIHSVQEDRVPILPLLVYNN